MLYQSAQPGQRTELFVKELYMALLLTDINVGVCMGVLFSSGHKDKVDGYFCKFVDLWEIESKFLNGATIY